MREVKVLPIKNCKECPYLERHTRIIRCDLSEVQSYEPDGDWITLLDQYCPLYNLQEIINDAYEMGWEHKNYMEKAIAKIIWSNKKTSSHIEWEKPEQYLEKMKEYKNGG